MELIKGCVVRSKAGRDKDLFLAVLAEPQNGEVMLSDGKARPLERPKRKNIKHISATNFKLSEEEMATNRALRRALAGFAVKR